jgi:hypothetical protein
VISSAIKAGAVFEIAYSAKLKGHAPRLKVVEFHWGNFIKSLESEEDGGPP